MSGAAPVEPSTNASTDATLRDTARSFLVLLDITRTERSALRIDPLEHAFVTGSFRVPAEGDSVTRADGNPARWQLLPCEPTGWLEREGLADGWAIARFTSRERRIALLEASGHAFAIVHGSPRAGDPYERGWLSLPVELEAGANHVLFRGGRGGRLRASLRTPPQRSFLDGRDAVLPDLVEGVAAAELLASVVVVNASERTLSGLQIESRVGEGPRKTTGLPDLVPLSVHRALFHIAAPASERGTVGLTLSLSRGEGDSRAVYHSLELSLVCRARQEPRVETFRSEIDGSVQSYAISPATDSQTAAPIALTLHGADTSAHDHVTSHRPRSWIHLVSPTNRRPFGFDWEDWGRLDALEALEVATKRLGADRSRTFLTGHSMGGHGVWHIATLTPGRFAAIAPSSGWLSFRDRADVRLAASNDPFDLALERAISASDTRVHLPNLASTAVSILHGEADTEVSVEESRSAFASLKDLHADLHYHEQAGAGHWWTDRDEGAVACIDHEPFFELFARRSTRPAAAATRVSLVTRNPGACSSSDWVRVIWQHRLHAPSRVDLRVLANVRALRGATENVARLEIDVAETMSPGTLRIEIDQSTLEPTWPTDGVLRLARDQVGGEWRRAEPIAPGAKSPERYGLFKDAFRHRVAFVYGTRGTPEEKSWARDKARFDAEVFWYRGGASVELLADRDFDPSLDRDRSVVLYGHADCNSRWSQLLVDSPIVVRRRSLELGSQQMTRDDLACFFVRPRPGSRTASVAVVAGTGSAGMRLASISSYFVSGVGYPDVLVISPDVLLGRPAGRIAAGYFENDWTLGEDLVGELTR